eukprot:jgi/Ulvmu1/12710/UM095_0014.1
MDANELSNLLEDVREFMTLVRTGERAFINQVTEVARENTAAHSPIGHVIEQYLLKADPALKIGALFCIDSICQQVGEPYVSYFSTNIAQMFLETWKYASASTRDRMRRWINMYSERQIFPPDVVQQIRHAVDPASLRKAPATASASASRNDPRKAMKRPGMTVPPGGGWSAPHAGPGRAMPPFPPVMNQQRPAVPPQQYMQPPGHVMYQRPGVAPPMYGMPPGTIPPPMPLARPPQAPLGTSFRGVRLQVCMINSFQASRCIAGCRTVCLAVQSRNNQSSVSCVAGGSTPASGDSQPSAWSARRAQLACKSCRPRLVAPQCPVTETLTLPTRA